MLEVEDSESRLHGGPEAGLARERTSFARLESQKHVDSRCPFSMPADLPTRSEADTR